MSTTTPAAGNKATFGTALAAAAAAAEKAAPDSYEYHMAVALRDFIKATKQRLDHVNTAVGALAPTAESAEA